MPKKTVRSSKRSWKNDKKANISRKKIVKLVSLILLVFLSVSLLLGYFSYKSLTVSFASASGSDSFDLINHDIFSVSVIPINDLDSSPVLTKNLSLFELSHISNFSSSLSTNDFITGPILNDDYIKDLAFDSNSAIEKKSVAILNGTDVSGIAWFGKRIAENMGIRVIASGNAFGKYDESMIIADILDSQTVGYLKRFFNINKVVLKENSEVNESVINRADITIIIGLDKANNL